EALHSNHWYMNYGCAIPNANCGGTAIQVRERKYYAHMSFSGAHNAEAVKNACLVLGQGRRPNKAEQQPIDSSAGFVYNPVARKKDIAAIAKDANRAVVSILMSDKGGHPVALGSGFLISKDGRVVTNYHVIRSGT